MKKISIFISLVLFLKDHTFVWCECVLMDFQELLRCTAFMVCVQLSFVNHFDKLDNREDLGRDLEGRGVDGFFFLFFF